jgi:hypothetical protein
MLQKNIVSIRGYLLHLTHYDPLWYLRKAKEKPIDINLAYEIIDGLGKCNFNLLIVDCADGLIYKLHPELRRRYSISIPTLKRLINYAQRRGLELIPKLNFSHSRYHRHNWWFRPYNKLFDNEQYFKIAFELIDELIRIFKPRRFFHIGMDEDDDRTHSQYIKAILTLRQGLKKRKLRPIIWNDTARGGSKPWHARKSLIAEKNIPKDIVQLVWDYRHVKPRIIHRIINEGFEVWVAPSQRPTHVLKWKKAILQYGGKGLIMTNWIPCRPRNRSKLLRLIQKVGPLYSAPLESHPDIHRDR